jgi:hypothetical protein
MKTAFIAVEQPQNELGNDLEGVSLKSVFPRTKAHQGAITALLRRYYGAGEQKGAVERVTLKVSFLAWHLMCFICP